MDAEDLQIEIGNVLDGMGVGQQLKSQSPIPEDISDYLAMVDWSETWLKVLLVFHITLLIIVLSSRNSVAVQSIVGLLMLGIVYLSERINQLAAENWRVFAGQQYFDSKGFFISAVLSAPLLFNCLIIIINFLLHNWYILKDIQQLKVRKLTHAAKSDSKQQNPADNGDTEDSTSVDDNRKPKED